MMTFLLYLPMRYTHSDTSLLSLKGLLLRPLSSCFKESSLFHLPGRFQINGTSCIRMGQHPQNDLENVLNFLIGEPLLLTKHLLADEALLDVGVVDGCSKLEEGELERKLLWEVDIE